MRFLFGFLCAALFSSTASAQTFYHVRPGISPAIIRNAVLCELGKYAQRMGKNLDPAFYNASVIVTYTLHSKNGWKLNLPVVSGGRSGEHTAGAKLTYKPFPISTSGLKKCNGLNLYDLRSRLQGFSSEQAFLVDEGLWSEFKVTDDLSVGIKGEVYVSFEATIDSSVDNAVRIDLTIPAPAKAPAR